jgi:hypothetical protein
MTSKLKTDVIETVSGSGTIALANQFSGMTHESMPSGSVIKTQHYSLGNAAVSAGTTSEVATFAFDKLEDSSYLLVALKVGINNEELTNSDDNSSIYIKNNTTATLITNSIYYPYQVTGAVFATDTSNAYGTNASAGQFSYHHFQVSVEVKDTSATSGNNVLALLLSAQNSTFRIGRWQTGSLTVTEIKQ